MDAEPAKQQLQGLQKKATDTAVEAKAEVKKALPSGVPMPGAPQRVVLQPGLRGGGLSCSLRWLHSFQQQTAATPRLRFAVRELQRFAFEPSSMPCEHSNCGRQLKFPL